MINRDNSNMRYNIRKGINRGDCMNSIIFAMEKLEQIESESVKSNSCMVQVYLETINQIKFYLKLECLDLIEERIFLVRLSQLNNEFAQNGFYKFI